MSSIIHNEKRDVFPIWRKYKDSLRHGELDLLEQKDNIEYIRKIEKEFDFQTVADWEKRKTLSLAADILNFGVLHNNNSKIFTDAAGFILRNQDKAGSSLISLARKAVNSPDDDEIEEVILTPKMYHINNLVYSEISRLKKMVAREPNFAVGWIELARNYVILAQKEKALRCIQIALHIAPNNRFVLRAAARFFVHVNDFEQGFDILAKSSLASTDPWVLSTILAMTRKIDKRTHHISKGRKLLSNERLTFYETSELNASLATIELFQGSHRSARKLFKNSLINPNENSLAQAAWLGEIEYQNDKGTFNQLFETAYEAETVQSYKKGDIEKSYKNNMEWIEEEPFSVRPLQTASYHALTFFEDFDEAINVTTLGLKTNPDNMVLKNNLIFSHIMKDDLSLAKNLLDGIEESKITGHLEATKGLYFFRNKDINRGRELYKSAIDNFKEKKNSYLETLAYLNYAREEILANTSLVTSVMQKVNDEYSKRSEKDIQHLHSKIIQLNKDRKSSD